MSQHTHTTAAAPGSLSHEGRTREKLAHFIAAVASALSPWWRFRLWTRLAGPTAYASHPGAEEHVRRISPHGFAMPLRESDWMERYARHSGAYYQDDLIALVRQEVREGEVFIDIGANVGFVTLTASRIVGPAGRVISIEANPAVASRLLRALEMNRIENVELHQLALGDRSGSVGLVTQEHHGTTHIGPADPGAALVQLRRGDDVLPQVEGQVFVKIDVEGAEDMVLRGLPHLLARLQTRWLIEISPDHLSRFGASPEQIFDIMQSNGYVACLPQLSPLSDRVKLIPISGPLARPIYDVLFVRPKEQHPKTSD